MSSAAPPRTVMCRKYGREMPGLDAPPFPGPKGLEVFETVSREAWADWMARQTRLINEKHLTMTDPAARKYLTEQREKFFANADDGEEAEGFVPPSGAGPAA